MMGLFERRKGVSLNMDDPTSWLSIITVILTFTAQVWASEPRVVCYYTNWSVYRPGTAKFNPQNINPYLCTHLIYAFGGFTKDNTLKPFDKYQDIEKGGYAKFTGLKTYNKNLKTMLAIGGWNEGSTRFSPMVASRERRKEFVRNAIKFLRQNHFDGLDLDWEYPAFRDGGKPKDRENYAKLVKELREEFERESEKSGKPRLLLTMAVPAGIEYIQKGFDVKTLNQYLDWMNLLTYDYHSAFEPAVNHHAPLYPLEEPNEYSVDNELNIDYTIKYYIENGADRDKLVLGIPTYGRSYTLFNPDATEIGAPADGPGEQGDATREKGYLAYYEICDALKEKKRVKRQDSDEEDEEEEEADDEPWTIAHPNPNAMGPVAFKGNQWVGYDDLDIVQKKAEYVAENGLGGIMFWSIDNDDFRGNCHDKPYPLIEAAKEAYINKIGATDNVVVTEKTKTVTSSSSRRRNRPKSTTTTKPSTARSNKRKSSSTTPSWSTPEPPTTPDPGSDFKCTDEGFFQHPRDCKKYFWCLDSGPSNLGIVAHQFTCPSGLFFNKAADSCDFSRNVFCKKSSATTKAPTTEKPSTTTKATTTTTEAYTTRKAIKLSTRNSLLFRSTTTTVAPLEEEQDEEEVVSEEVDGGEIEAEDPRVIKELIDLIKKVGGVEQLEKHLHLAETSMSSGNEGTTTPASFNKKLYQKVLERTRKNKYNPVSVKETGQYSRRGPQNAGLEGIQETASLRKERPQYTTINRGRPSTSTTEEPSQEDEPAEEEDDEPPRPQFRARSEDNDITGTTAKPLQYVNIRRARPTSTSDTADDSASRNSLFERQQPIATSASEPSSNINLINSKRESMPEYVTIRRQRPTTEEATTVQYSSAEREEDPSESVETETSISPSTKSQPQYISLVRSRSTTQSTPSEELLHTPEPTTILAVQISSLLNSPSSTVADELPTEIETTPTPAVTETTSTTTTVAPRLSIPPRRTVFKRRGSTTSAPSTTTTTTNQVSSERQYAFVQRRRPLTRPNEISQDLDETNENARKIRSTTPDSREDLNVAKTEGNNQKPRRYRLRYQQPKTEDSAPAAATIPRGQYRPQLSRDDLLSLTPLDGDVVQTEPREPVARPERRFRPRTSTTVADKVEDSEVSAATVDVRRPNLLPRGRNRFTLSTSTEAPKEEQYDGRPAVSRFTPRPFTRRTPAEIDVPIDEEEDIAINPTPRAPIRLPFGRNRPTTTITREGVQARKLPFPLTRLSTPTIENDDDNVDEDRNDDITLSESTIEEKEHEEEIQETTEELPKRRKIIRKIRPLTTEPDSKPTESSIVANPTESQSTEKQLPNFTVIRRRLVSTSTVATETTSNSPAQLPSSSSPRIRKIVRKLIKPTEEPQIEVKKEEQLESISEPIANYGERSRPIVTTSTSTAEIDILEDDKVQEKTPVEQSSEEKENSELEKPEVVIENDQILDISENKEEIPLTEAQATTESTTLSTTQEPTSASTRARVPYRPQKRLFTSTTEATPLSSARTYSRKYSSRTYTSSPSTFERSTEPTRATFTRRPLFNARPFTRRPYTTASTTQKIEDEEEYESQEEEEEDQEEPGQNFEVVPENQFFKRRPDNNDAEEEYSQEEEQENEDEVQPNNQQTVKPFFRPKVVNSNTFRTSTTTEIPKRKFGGLGSEQNRTNIVNRFKSNDTDSKKRVVNVPIGYESPKPNVTNEPTSTQKVIEITTESDEELVTTTNFTETEATTEEDDYLSYTESSDTTVSDSMTTYADGSTTNTESDQTTSNMASETTDDYLEALDDTTVYPIHTTVDDNDNTASTSSEENATSTEENTTTEKELEQTTYIPQVSPIVKTQYDKLFSVSRVVEVSSKLDKHRLSKNNESRLIESGEIMQEKKPTVDKIGEVSRFSFIKIVEDDIPIYLTKYGHIYPVDNPPDNPIRIDEARNARALNNFADVGKENLIASESINEAYRHVNNLSKKANNEETNPKGRVEHLLGDDFLSFINDDKKDDKANRDSLATYWQFVPAAYENEQNRQNKGAKKFEVITPRNILTDPSTLALEGLFKTENPLAVTKKNNDNNENKQPFVVYSSPVQDDKKNANFGQLKVLPSEGARNIKTYVKGQELNGASEEATIKYPVFVSVIPKEETTILTTVTEAETNKFTESYSEMSTTPMTTYETEITTVETTVPTTETVPEETTTIKSLFNSLNENAKKRPKFAFPRRPNTKPIAVTRPSTTPRTIKKISTLSNLKANKTIGFNPTKSRFSANRAQNVPVDLRSTIKAKAKTFTTEASKPSVTTERVPYYKSLRPSFRPSFIPRRPLLSSTKPPKRQRPNFLRRTKAPPTDATESPDNDLTTEFSTIVENTTRKYNRRGLSKFKNNTRADSDRRVPFAQGELRRPSAVVRRRLGGANATTAVPSSTTQAPSSSRRPFRVTSRRRPLAKTTTTTTTSTTTPPPSTVTEETLQDIDDSEEELKPRRLPFKKTVKVQRRPLVTLKDQDSSPSSEENKRQSKKYSSSFKQNQLDEVIRQKTKSSEVQDVTTEASGPVLDLSGETAVAIAAHQLLAAPIPTVENFDEPKTTRKAPKPQIQDFTFTPEYTDPFFQNTQSKVLYSTNYPSGYTTTPSYASTSRSPAPFSSGILTNSAGFSGVSQPHLNPSTARYLGTSEKYVSIPVEEFGYSTEGFTGGLGQEPVYFTREYLLESPVTKTYDDEYQYLSPITTPQTTTLRNMPKKLNRKISTTQRPTALPPITSSLKPRRVPQKKPFEKIPKNEPKKVYRPIENYDYYDDSDEKFVNKYSEGTKVIVHGKGSIQCLDVGNFPHPTSCKKFISCAKMENGSIIGWEYVCPEGLSFDPVGGICNWSAGLGCEEN